MRIGCLQFAPKVGDVDNNLNRADSVLSRADTSNLDLLVLPELAFTGYNFTSLQHITPYLEPTGAGITSLWARTTALKHNCMVVVGYPEKVDLAPRWPTGPEYYNSAVMVSADGETIANYRKTHLYYTDETWALESQQGFYEGDIPGLGRVAMGICMDINPYKFEAPWDKFEFATHVQVVKANLVILSLAWLTREDLGEFSRQPNEPDMDTMTYWVSRLEPCIRNEGGDEIIFIFCNRTGAEGSAVYAGTSAVIGVKDGEVKVYGILGRGQKELLVVDTDKEPIAKLVQRDERTTELESPVVTNGRTNLPGAGDASSVRTGGAAKRAKPAATALAATGRATGTISNTPPPQELTQSARPKRPNVPRLSIPNVNMREADPPKKEKDGDSPQIPTPTGPSPTPTHLRPKFEFPLLSPNSMLPPVPQLPAAFQPISPWRSKHIFDGNVDVSAPFSPVTPMDLYSPSSADYQWVNLNKVPDPKEKVKVWNPPNVGTPPQSPPQPMSPSAPPQSLPRSSRSPPKSRSPPREHRRTPSAEQNAHRNGVNLDTPAGLQLLRRLVESPKPTVTRHPSRAVDANPEKHHQHHERIVGGAREGTPTRPSSPKSRNASRSRMGERSDSVSAHSDLNAVVERLDSLSRTGRRSESIGSSATSHHRAGSITRNNTEVPANQHTRERIVIAASESVIAGDRPRSPDRVSIVAYEENGVPVSPTISMINGQVVPLSQSTTSSSVARTGSTSSGERRQVESQPAQTQSQNQNQNQGQKSGSNRIPTPIVGPKGGMLAGFSTQAAVDSALKSPTSSKQRTRSPPPSRGRPMMIQVPSLPSSLASEIMRSPRSPTMGKMATIMSAGPSNGIASPGLGAGFFEGGSIFADPYRNMGMSASLVSPIDRRPAIQILPSQRQSDGSSASANEPPTPKAMDFSFPLDAAGPEGMVSVATTVKTAAPS